MSKLQEGSSSLVTEAQDSALPCYLPPDLAALDAHLLQRLSQGQSSIVVWIAESNKALVPELQRLCCQYQIELAGAIFPALIYQGQFVSEGCLVSVLPERAKTLLLSCTQTQSCEQNVRLLQDAVDQFTDTEGLNLLLIFDAQLPNISDILDLIYLGLHNDVRYLGANAGSETFQPMPCVFNQTEWIGEGLLALLIPSDHQGGLAHGYKASSTVTATSTDRNRIQSIEWRNAFEVYQEQVYEQFGRLIDQNNFYDYAVHFPFGITRISGQPLVRIPVALEADGTLICVGDIPEHTVLTLLKGVEPNSDETLSALIEQTGTSSSCYQVFYCAGRKMHLGEKSAAELMRLHSSFTPSQLSGAVSLGEISNENGQGYPLFHNAAIVCCPWI